MKKLTADRRLWLTAEKDQVVEEGDGLAAFLLAGVGRTIPAAEAKRLKLKLARGRIVYPDGPAVEELQEEEDTGEDTAEETSEDAPGKVFTFGGGEDSSDDSDRNDEAPPEWPGRTSPKTYLRLYPTGPKAELARAVIAAQDDGADGGS